MKIVCDGQEFPCHKFILSARSDVFRTMFAFDSSLKMNGKEEFLEIPDVSARHNPQSALSKPLSYLNRLCQNILKIFCKHQFCVREFGWLLSNVSLSIEKT